MRLNADNSFVFRLSLIVFIYCIVQHINNISIVSKKITKICARVTRDPVSSFRVGVEFIWQKRSGIFCEASGDCTTTVVCTNCQNTENTLRISSTDYKYRQHHDNVTGLKLIPFSCFY
jgi:hypothetical protein